MFDSEPVSAVEEGYHAAEARARATDVILVICVVPLVIVARNYFHGTLMVRRRTRGMAVGGVVRVLAIAALAQAAYAAQWLDHMVAAYILLVGFVVETAVVLVGHVRLRRVLPNR